MHTILFYFSKLFILTSTSIPDCSALYCCTNFISSIESFMLNFYTFFLNFPFLNCAKSKISFTKKFNIFSLDIYILTVKQYSFSIFFSFFRNFLIDLIFLLNIRSLIFSLSCFCNKFWL